MTPFDQSPPRFSEAELLELARFYFGIEGSLSQLDSERDQNARIRAADGQAYVLKVSNAAEDPALLELQDAALRHIALRDPALGVPKVIEAKDGGLSTTISSAHGTSHKIRLLSYLEGNLLAECEKTDALLESMGRFLGRLDRALSDFMHPAALRPEFLWNLDNPAACYARIGHVHDAEDRSLVEAVFEGHEKTVAGRLANLRRGVIHQDANDYNVLVGPKEDRVSGLIDFGDMLWGCQVNELAVALAYAVMDAADPLAAACRITRGYNTVSPLAEDDFAVLFDLAKLRLAMSIVISSWRSKDHPENDYLLISQRQALAVLRRLSPINSALACFTLRRACGLEPVPQAVIIEDWLANETRAFAPIIGRDLGRTTKAYLPMTTGAQGVEHAGDPQAHAAFLDQFLKRENAEFAIGGYLEDRAVYLGDQFAPAEGGAARSVHLGIDIFGAEGTPVHAPLAGVVVSVADNDAPFDYGPTVIIEHEAEGTGVKFWTLYGHLARDSVKHIKANEAVTPGQRIGAFGSPTENGGWGPHVHFQVMSDLIGLSGNFPGVAEPGLVPLWRRICLDPNLILGLTPEALTVPARARNRLLSDRQRLIGPSLSLSYAEPLEIVRGKGVWLYDERGRAYLDCVNNICHVGHCHPKIVEALTDQARRLNTNTRYLHETILAYADRIAATMPDPLGVCFFVCSGSEANELAIRLARTYTGRREAIVLENAYHGNTVTLVDHSPYKCEGPGGRGLPPWVQKAAMPDPFRGPFRGADRETGAKYAEGVKATVEALQRAGTPPAFLIAESILGVGGQVVLPPSYLSTAYESVREAGGLCIADEVQVGFGRVGSHMWAFETQGVVPDIVSLGKPIGNGHPVGCVVTRPEIAEAFSNGMEYFNSFGGNPVSCAVGMAVLDVIEAEGLQRNAAEVGSYLMERLAGLGDRFALIGDVRGLGLFIGVELVRDPESLEPATAEAKAVVNSARQMGVLLSTDGPHDNVIKIKPPIVFSRENADLLVDTLAEAMSGLD